MDLLIWQMRKNCSLFITSGTLSQLTGNTSICNTSKIDFRRLEALFCGVWPSPDFSLLSSRISLQNREKFRFEPTFKKACPARLSERKKPDFKRLSAGTGLTETAPKRTPPSQLHKRLEMQLSARARGFESHRFRHQSLENSMFSRLFLLLGHHLFWGKQFKWCPWCPALWCPAHSTSYTLYKKDVYCGAPMVPGTAKKL